jgi:hypothetical protein
MYQNLKLAPALRKEVYVAWKKEKRSLRELASEYHVDKRVIGRIIERGKKGDFSVHTSTNHRYIKKNTRAGTVIKK